MESTGRHSYSRKEKSLGVLVSNFLKLYNSRDDDVVLIGLDDAAGKLGVERRRIYDVVNILESIGLVARRGKNQYSWKGFGEVPLALDELKEEGMREKFDEKFGIVPCVTNREMVLYEEEREESFRLTPDDQENSQSSRLDNKKEKSLWVLSRNFVKLFLCSDNDLITLDGATKALLSEPQDPLNMRTKVRRLYDIANVFSSMNLIEKTHIPASKKPAYRWLGAEAISVNRFLADSPSLCDRNEPRKRTFGTEITNFNTKRNKTDCTKDLIVKEEEEYDLKPDVKKVAFGPAPAAATGTSRNGNIGHTLGDLEALSSTYQPQYCNNALFGLLGHFTETYKTWHAEFGKK